MLAKDTRFIQLMEQATVEINLTQLRRKYDKAIVIYN